MKRPRFPSPPAGIKIAPYALRDLAWYIRRRKESPYATKPCINLKVDGYWTSPINVSAHDWNRFGKKGVKIGYSSGGSNESDNFDYIHNFIAGLQYAMVLADWMDQFYTYIESTIDKVDEVA